MDPKFQSSFIPRGPIIASGAGMPAPRKVGERSLLSFLAMGIFTISVLLALGVFGYKLYLNYRISAMGADLEGVRAAIQPETISELVRLDDRITSTKELISKHQVLTPLFEFLETSTPKTVRFNNFRYAMTDKGDLELSMKGEARGYAALALQADIFGRSQYFKNTVFSDLNLNDRGDVTFSFTATVDPSLISYQRMVEGGGVPVIPPIVSAPIATTTSTTTSPRVATSTPN